ncbi:MAG: AI-2E family transporter [Leptospirales bacterium]|jgi:predicted PurR-regulated permease PerM
MQVDTQKFKRTRIRGDVANFLVQLFFVALLVAFVAFIVAGVTALAIPIGIAFLVALALNPAADFLEGLGIPRFFAVLFVLLGMIGVTILATKLVLPLLIGQIGGLVAQQHILQDRAAEALSTLQLNLSGILPERVTDNLAPEIAIPAVRAQLSATLPQDLGFLGNFVTYLFVTPIITIVFLWQGHEIFHRLMYMVPNRYFEMVILLVYNIYESIIAYIKGLSIQFVILSTVFCAGFYLIGLPYWPVIGLVAATVNIIPYLGPALGAIPAVAVALLEGGDGAAGGGLVLPALIVIGVAQLIDNALIQPIILARSVELHPLIAIMAVITMQQYLGIIGMVVAIPLASIVMVSIEIMYRQLKAFGII